MQTSIVGNGKTGARAHSAHGHEVVDVDSYACRRCGRVLFRKDEIAGTRPLWDLGEEANEVFVKVTPLVLALRSTAITLPVLPSWISVLMRPLLMKVFNVPERSMTPYADVAPPCALTIRLPAFPNESKAPKLSTRMP